MRLEHYQLASLIAQLITCGERLDIAENPDWHACAIAAARLEDLHAGKPVDLAAVFDSLQGIRDRVAAVDSKIALNLDIVLTVVDALRLGLLELDAPPVWIGIDMAAGPDRTARRTFHA